MKLTTIAWHFDGACIRCTSHYHSHGYPITRRNGKANKIVQQIASKRANLTGLVTRHTCDNAWCINPSHILLGSQADNLADMRSRKRHAFGEKHGRRKLTPVQVLSIFNDEGLQSEIAERYGIQQPTVSKIKLGQRWKHLGL